MLRDLGVVGFVPYGGESIGGFKVLGKGHSSVVFAVFHKDYGVIALKVRREDSKRDSLILECRLLEAASPVAPKVFFCHDDVVGMELIRGRRFEELIRGVGSCWTVLTYAIKVLAAGWWLDRLGIDHKELSYAREHVIVDERDSVRVVDFESATFSRKCNLCRLFSWLFMRLRVHELTCPGFEERLSELLNLVRLYKRSDDDGRESTFKAIVKVISEFIR